MDSLIDAESVERPRVVAIVLAGLIGFLAGQILGSLFELVGASLAHYPGGLSALAKVSSPPWWANALGLLGLWTGFGIAIYYAYAYGNLRALPSQWRVQATDVFYVALETAASGWMSSQLQRGGFSTSVGSFITAAFWMGMTIGRSLGGPLHRIFNDSRVFLLACRRFL